VTFNYNFSTAKSKHAFPGTADNKTRGKIAFLEKGLKIVRKFSDNSETVPHLPWIKSKVHFDV